ncbi:hypothetical protein QNI16_07010 [Cytophagaceae bacterium YF14B1]|uniref:Uncharacterized protein n=1 Tax=Xanthocytophaga flava TaxID=3048013 RepID=A0AAE3U7L1_9BACT|nr:hypothetical protein [Xanthocytophaga flavus]MDJ1480228.1 hypothetical protein [Xanthocytophaga flavus]
MKPANGWPIWKTIQLVINQDTAQEIIDSDPYNHDGRYIEKASQQRF